MGLKSNKSTFYLATKNILSHDTSFMPLMLQYVMSFIHLEVAIHAFSVWLLVQCCDTRHSLLLLPSGIL